MRPLFLTIEGFETYCKKTQIDFSKLGNQGLYLITGDTGSGKTTIFDAITFALFGVASGDVREPKMLRSTLAEVGVPTEVELKFEFRDREYTVKRNYDYPVPKERGEGVKIKKSDAILIFPDGSDVSGVEEVNKKIKEILGINSDQFRQISMIAQGSFQKVLTASSKERIDLFMTLFKTEKYKMIEMKIDQDSKDLKSKKEQTESVFKTLLSGVSCSSDSSYKDELDNAKDMEISWTKRSEIINNIIKEDEEKKKSLDSSKANIQKEYDKVNLLVEELKKLKEDKELLKRTEEALQIKDSLVKELEETTFVYKDAYENLGEKESEKALIENELIKYDELDEKNNNLKNLKNSSKKLSDAVNRSDSEISKKEKVIKNLNEENDSLKDANVKEEKLINEKEKNENRVNEISLLLEKNGNVKTAKTKLDRAQKVYIDVRSEYDKLNDIYQNMNKAFLDGQAGIIASQLKEGVPCPVCGSIEHPHPCSILSEVPSEKELKKAKEDAEEKSEEMNEKSKICASFTAEHKAKEEEYISSFKKLFNKECEEDSESFISSELNSTKVLLESVKDELKICEEKTLRKEKIEKQLPTEQKLLEDMKTSKINNNNELLKVDADIKNLEAAISELKESLKFASKKEAQSKVSSLEQIIDKTKKAYNDAVENFNNAKNEQSTLQGKLKAVNERIEKSKVKEEDSEKINEQFSSLKELIAKNEIEGNAIVSRLTTNSNAYKTISEQVCEFEKDEKRLAMINAMCNTVKGGSIGDSPKVQLVTYAQMAYFDMVLHYANQRLKIMSGGQYEFVRRTEGKKAQTGLDIDIFDHYVGKGRDVKSLSGGESFQASLSLALGLSDEVCNTAGGIKLDTMFIDEGFGTLDNETMQKAYEALINVSQGNKLVGIISHVDFLKEHIDKQIIVTKDRNEGSTAVIK